MLVFCFESIAALGVIGSDEVFYPLKSLQIKLLQLKYSLCQGQF